MPKDKVHYKTTPKHNSWLSHHIWKLKAKLMWLFSGHQNDWNLFFSRRWCKVTPFWWKVQYLFHTKWPKHNLDKSSDELHIYF